jgi:hypothetical protein
MRIGIDVGGVIIESGHDQTDTSFFSENYLSTPEVKDAFTTIRGMVEQSHEVYIISKAGPKTAEKTLRWLSNRGFSEYTGVGRDRIVFTRTRAQKAPIAHLLELDLMVDDNLEICAMMDEVGIRSVTSLKSVRFLGYPLGYHVISNP